MDPPPKSKRVNHNYYTQRKTASKKIVDKLTNNPLKHKQKVTRALRQKLQKKNIPPEKQASPPSPTIKFGSFNVNGLDTEAAWAIEELLKQQCFDVSFTNKNYFFNTVKLL
jgi:hypothetical protein